MRAGRRENAAGNDGNAPIPAPIPASTTAASVSMEYDLWGRMVRRSHAGASLAFAYDAAGRLTQLTNENDEHTTFAWDAMDRLAKETGFDARVQSYQYDAAGQLAQSSDGWAAEQSLPAHTSRYEWTPAGQLAARHLPAGEHTPAATHRYEWGKAGELLKASVWHGQPDEAPASMPRLQSEALMERDATGRVIGEVQRLYKPTPAGHTSTTINNDTGALETSSEPELEFEHRISHRLDVLGNREASQLHGLGEVGYRYDAFGRRLAKYNDPDNSQTSKGTAEESGTDYFGWDGDRLVHTERLGSGNAKNDTDTPQPEVIHTVYEPGSFTPLVQLRRAAKAEPDLADELIAHMQPGIAQDALRGMFADIGATNALVNAGLGNLGMAVDAQDFIREQFKEFEETVNSQREENAKAVEIRHYLCDHLGTPNALVSNRGQIEWAAMLDAWGNVKAEHNPKELYQPIRLPGQHEDKSTSLYYNRHRFYDFALGRYTNQDLIGLHGGANLYSYVKNPQGAYDSLGFFETLTHIWNIGPYDAWQTSSDNTEALQRAQDKFPNSELHNGKGDAFRHCYWSCIMGLRMGVDQSKKVGDTHEEYGTSNGQRKEEEIMDYYNNQKGRDCAVLSKNKKDCENNCDKKLNDGELWFIDKKTKQLITTVNIP